jgi:hypothetical protein
MKLKDCDCGGIPQVTYEINEHKEFVVGCTVCNNRTPSCENLMVSIWLWNQIYYCALPPYENELA